jgi:hypothetical protein
MNNNQAAHLYRSEIRDAVVSLKEYCVENGWAGVDPYDALNSRVFNATPFSRSKVCRIAATQVMKRLPFNLRSILGVPRKQNAKAMGLFLMAALKLSKLGITEGSGLADSIVERLVSLRSLQTPYWCWGYSFPWQTRTVLVPEGAPNLVCTTFVANALLDAYEYKQESQYLSMATSAGEYILNDLYWTDGEIVAGFSYPLPGLRVQVHNANFLAAALLCRLYKHTGCVDYLGPALRVAHWSANEQHADGSWDYGSLATQRWVDNFHTGYNLCALRSIGQDADTSEFESHLVRGFEFYRARFFLSDGRPKYFHDRTFPIDIHCVAQSVITLIELESMAKGNFELAVSVFRWAMKHMRHKQGYFYYQVLPFRTNKISYMRWSQAWMLLALATLLEKCHHPAERSI